MPKIKSSYIKAQKKINQRLKEIAKKRPNAPELIELVSNICRLCYTLFTRDDSKHIKRVLIPALKDLASILKDVLKNKDMALRKVFRFSETLLDILETYLKDKDTAHEVGDPASRILDSTTPPIEDPPHNPTTIEEDDDEEASMVSALRSDVSGVYHGHVQALIDLHRRFIVDSSADEEQSRARGRASSRSSYGSVLEKTGSQSLPPLSSVPEEPHSSAAVYYAEDDHSNVYADVDVDTSEEDDDKEPEPTPGKPSL